MDYDDFSDDEKDIVAAVRRFVEGRVRPAVMQHERDRAYPAALVAEMKEMGLYGLAVPQEFGGLGLRVPVFAAVMEVLAGGWSTLSAYVNSHATVAYAIAAHGTEDQKARYLPAMARGEHRGALCLTEPHCGSDLQAVHTTALPADDGFRVRGTKIFVTNGGTATLLLVLCRDPQGGAGARPGFSLLLVEKGFDGVETTSVFHKMGFELVDTVQIELGDVPVPAANVLSGATGRGFPQLMDALESGRIAIAASAVGVAADALSIARRYAAERETFGVTIDKHQAIQLKLADAAAKLMAAHLMTMEAARAKERGERADMRGAMAKMYASERALEICHIAMQIMGGAGYTRDWPLERLTREATLYVTGEGTNDINRLVIARRLRDDGEAESIGLHT